MSLYSLNKDILIKIISEVGNLKNYPIQEITKIKNNCILELSKKTEALTHTIAIKKKRLVQGLENFRDLLCNLDTERLYIDFIIHDIKNYKTEHLILSRTSNVESHLCKSFLKPTIEAYLCLDFGQDRICLTTSLEHFDCLFDTILLVTEIVIFYSNNSIYAEMERH
jgi:hypothetical protein